jgi:zinc-ribbon domain
MFCPKCATQNVDGASFCRACGANISLVSHALNGQLPVAVEPSDQYSRYSRRKRRREPSIEEAMRGIMMGIAFVVVSLLVMEYAPAGKIWWFWMLIPAAGSLGRGIAELMRVKNARRLDQGFSQPQLNTVRPNDLPAPKTGELLTPAPSVTEGTTQLLDNEPQTRHLDSAESRNRS